MRDTPETDDLARGNHVVPTEWAEQLERERDEAKEHSAENGRGLNRLSESHKFVLSELVAARKERDILLEAAKAVVARWDMPSWKDTEPTAVVIYKLRDAIHAVTGETLEDTTQ